jgi:hypothetical protein
MVAGDGRERRDFAQAHCGSLSIHSTILTIVEYLLFKDSPCVFRCYGPPRRKPLPHSAC